MRDPPITTDTQNHGNSRHVAELLLFIVFVILTVRVTMEYVSWFTDPPESLIIIKFIQMHTYYT